MSHELAHQFQSQVSRNKHRAVRWISEGTADYVAGQVLELVSLNTLAALRGRYEKVFFKAPRRPRLFELHAKPSWTNAEERYGTEVAYRAADLAVWRLAEAKGLKSLFAYFRRLKTAAPELAFHETFGMPLQAFEEEADRALHP